MVDLVKQQFQAEEIFKAANKPERRLNLGALALVGALTTSKINDQFNEAKKRSVELVWPEVNCDHTVTTTATDCDITATEPEDDSQEYTLNRTRQAEPFKISDRKFESSVLDADIMVAENVIQQEKALVTDFNARIHTLVNTPANKTDISDAGYGVLSDNVDPTSKDILIHPAQWTMGGIAPIMYEVASRLGMKRPTLLTGGALFRMAYDIWKDKLPGDVARFGDFEAYLDWSMDGTLGGEKVFMVDEGVMAILNRPDFMNTTPLKKAKERTVWSRDMIVVDGGESRFAVGTSLKSGLPVRMKVDVEHQIVCNSRKEDFHAYRYALAADLAFAPRTECSATAIGGNPYTGIVGFACGIPAES